MSAEYGTRVVGVSWNAMKSGAWLTFDRLLTLWVRCDFSLVVTDFDRAPRLRRAERQGRLSFPVGFLNFLSCLMHIDL